MSDRQKLIELLSYGMTLAAGYAKLPSDNLLDATNMVHNFELQILRDALNSKAEPKPVEEKKEEASTIAKKVLCGFNEAWIGHCKNIVNESGWCTKHMNMKCIVCGEHATHTCAETFQFVCGYALCNDCEHKQNGTLNHGRRNE